MLVPNGKLSARTAEEPRQDETEAVTDTTLDGRIRLAKREMMELARQYFAEHEQAPPERLYHYTNLSGLIGICDSGRLWATDSSYLNDPREMLHGIGLFREVIASLEAGCEDEGQRSFLKHAASRLDSPNPGEGIEERIYCASLSAARDDLSQYRAYADGGSGYCLGFDVPQVLAAFRREVNDSTERSKFHLVRMEYDKQKQQDALTRLVEIALKQYQCLNLVGGSQDRPAIPYQLAQGCVAAARFIVFCGKKQGFSAEKEWRILPDPEDPPLLQRYSHLLRVRPSGTLLVPYLDLPIADVDEVAHTALKEIIVGPKLPFERAERGIRLFANNQARVQEGKFVFPSGGPEVARSATSLR